MLLVLNTTLPIFATTVVSPTANKPLSDNSPVSKATESTNVASIKFPLYLEVYFVNPKAEKMILVMDKFSTHSASALYEVYSPADAKRIWDRFDFVYTQKHGSWLNIAEIELMCFMDNA